MKIIEINGSPRLNGNTNNILNLCENILIEIQHSNNCENKYERINISEYNSKYFKGCRICFDLSENKCPQKFNVNFIFNTTYAII